MLFSLCPVVGICGFGVDGRGVAAWLLQQLEVERVMVFDDRWDGSVDASSTLDLSRIEKSDSLDDVGLLFRSPGFPLTHPLILDAQQRAIPITSSTERVLALVPHVTVGITGSNGKTTCTALIEECLKKEYGALAVERGGNDGVPRLDLLSTSPEGRNQHFLVLELSSFQLIDSSASPDVAIVLNISPNHLDWHADMNEYAHAKCRIAQHSRGREIDCAILNADDSVVATFAYDTPKHVRWFDALPDYPILCKTHPDTLRAAVTAARVLGVSEHSIRSVLASFPGVPHRMQFVREIDGASYYNDSSCTTPVSAVVGIRMFPKGSVIVLLGGRDKGMDFAELYQIINEYDVRVVPYGEMAHTFISNCSSDRCIIPDDRMSFESVIAAAQSAAKPGDNVLLSPTCASFDMFPNAKVRGQRFEEIVRGL